MKKMIKKKLNQYGFSLIEIMVAVAIVGLLTSIAIPQYQKYQRKSLQNEAKILLSNMYTIERVFSLNWGYGTPNLQQLGFVARGNLAYNAGFNVKAAGTCNTNDTTRPSCSPGYQGPVVASTGETKLIDIHNLCTGTPCSHQHTNPETLSANAKVENTFRKVQFTIEANRKFGNGKQDRWTIDHNKRLRNIESGI